VPLATPSTSSQPAGESSILALTASIRQPKGHPKGRQALPQYCTRRHTRCIRTHATSYTPSCAVADHSHIIIADQRRCETGSASRLAHRSPEKRGQSFRFLIDTLTRAIAASALSSLRSCWIWLCLTGAPCGEGGLSNSIAIDRSSEQFLSSDAERERTYQQANGVQQKQRHDAPLQRPAACDSTMEYSKWPTASLQQCSRSWTHWDDSACAWRLLSAANPLKHSV
jgi:hypothetical protein